MSKNNVIVDVKTTINRTILELKYATAAASTLLTASINRTILELKYQRLHLTGAKDKSINRTILELKLRTNKFNTWLDSYQSYHTGIEIDEAEGFRFEAEAINCTTPKWKYFSDIYFDRLL